MRPIPLKLRKEIAADPFMKKCIYPGCPNTPEWEHAIIYAGKQVNEKWAIVPCCKYHHRGKGLDKNYNRYVAYHRLWNMPIDYIISQRKKYLNAYDRWEQEYTYLGEKYMFPSTG